MFIIMFVLAFLTRLKWAGLIQVQSEMTVIWQVFCQATATPT